LGNFLPVSVILNGILKSTFNVKFQKYFNTVVFLPKSNLGQLTAKSEKVDFFWDTLMQGNFAYFISTLSGIQPHRKSFFKDSNYITQSTLLDQ